MYIHTQGEASRGGSCPKMNRRTHTGPTYVAGRKQKQKQKQQEKNSKKAKQNKCAHVTTVHRFAPASNQEQSEQLFRPNPSCFAPQAVIVTLSLLAGVLLAAINPLASRGCRTLDWQRSARRRAFPSASAPCSAPRCHMPTFFAAVIQSRPSFTTTPNAIHFHSLPLREIAKKASIFFWRKSPQDVAGRPLCLGPCTASHPNMMRFESLESPYQVDASGLSFRRVRSRPSRTPFHTIELYTWYDPFAESRWRAIVACGGQYAGCQSPEYA